jgi:hypothetical protein
MSSDGVGWRVLFIGLILTTLGIAYYYVGWQLALAGYLFTGLLIWGPVLEGYGKWYLAIPFWMPIIAFGKVRDWYVENED